MRTTGGQQHCQFLDTVSRTFHAFGLLVHAVALFQFHQRNNLCTHLNTQIRLLLRHCASFLVGSTVSNAVCLKFKNKENFLLYQTCWSGVLKWAQAVYDHSGCHYHSRVSDCKSNLFVGLYQINH